MDGSSYGRTSPWQHKKYLQTRHAPELTEIVAVWPELPEHIKAAIKALVQTHIQGD